jgi:hypothetical protein
METREEREQRERQDSIFIESCIEIMRGNDLRTLTRWRDDNHRGVYDHATFERHITSFFSRGNSKTFSENVALISALITDPEKWEHLRNLFALALVAFPRDFRNEDEES